MKILYVEDDPRHADLTLRVLRRSAPQIQMETATTIYEARVRLDHLSSEPLDLVLVDMHLRDGDGLTLLQHIRENGLPLAVVLVTGMGDEETAVAALKSRADDYVVKHKDYLNRLPVILDSALNHYRADAARRSRPLNILYAEDDPADLENTRRHFALHADHLRLDAVFTGPEVLSALQPQEGGRHYDVLLLNFDLYELSALEVLRELRLTQQHGVPVVLLCSEGDEELARQGLKLGATGFLVKTPGYLFQLPWELEEAHFRADLIRREADLQASEARNRAILNALPDLMFLQSLDGTFIDFHARELNMLLNAPEDFLGKRMQEVLPAQVASDLAACFERALVSEKPITLEFGLEMPNGPRVYEASIVNCDGDKILSMVRDITERKEAEESLRTALAEVRQLKDRLHEENIYLQEEIRVARNFGEIVGCSEALEHVLRQAEQVAPTDTTVLILGETGTGKELLAHAIHNLSPRKEHTLVKVNCAALPAPLIESELFGHEKGAFTGASTQRPGRFELANGGTIFLDEVGELPVDLQAKLLRVLEQGEFERVGGTRTLNVNVRVIAATNRDLAESMDRGTFRPDLYYRFSVYPLTLPALRERREDIPMLVMHLVKQLSAKMGKEIDTVPHRAMAALQNYHWPGNVRELRNVIERAVIITRGSTLQLSDSPEAQAWGVAPRISGDVFESIQAPATETLVEHEHNLILSTLKRVNWKVEGPGGAAQLLKINPSTLRTRMKKLGINRS